MQQTLSCAGSELNVDVGMGTERWMASRGYIPSAEFTISMPVQGYCSAASLMEGK